LNCTLEDKLQSYIDQNPVLPLHGSRLKAPTHFKTPNSLGSFHKNARPQTGKITIFVHMHACMHKGTACIWPRNKNIPISLVHQYKGVTPRNLNFSDNSCDGYMYAAGYMYGMDDITGHLICNLVSRCKACRKYVAEANMKAATRVRIVLKPMLVCTKLKKNHHDLSLRYA
jgi:hypothetical protein